MDGVVVALRPSVLVLGKCEGVKYGILTPKLIAWKPQYDKVVFVFALLSNLLVELLQALELWCEAAFRGGVHNENDFVVKLRQVVGGTLLCDSLSASGQRDVEEVKGRRVAGTPNSLSLGLKS